MDRLTGAGAYLDHAATSPLRAEALEAMLPVLRAGPANPSGAHSWARTARRALEDARDEVADLLGADPGEVVLTSGGTEADNLAVFGGWEAARARRSGAGDPGGAVVCAAMEHHAVLNSCRALAARRGLELREVPTGPDGVVDLDALAEACTGEVDLVAVMAVNNELGTVQPTARVVSVARARAPRAVVVVDAVQAAPWLDVAERCAGAELVAVSAHKLGGPVGVGVLVARGGLALAPLAHGGGQERERRSGTPDVAGAVGMAAALRATTAERPAAAVRVAGLRDRLATGLQAAVPDLVVTGVDAPRVPGHLHVRIPGVEAEALVVLLDGHGVAASAGAACASGATGPSHVLTSMGLDRAEAASGVRFSLGPATTDGEVDLALAVVPDAITRLRD